MKKALHVLALASLVASSAGCQPQTETPEDSGILDEYVKETPAVDSDRKEDVDSTPDSRSMPDEETTQPTESPAVDAETSKYTDGTYSAAGNYQSPAGAETMQVSITIKGDTVTAVSISPAASNEVSLQLQNAFAGGISALVVGKSLDEIGGYSAVNGASLTSKGFDVALAQIRTLAQ